MNIPPAIERLAGGRPYTVDGTGLSGAKILCYDDMVLKIGPQPEALAREYRMLQWLWGRLPVPRPLHLAEEKGMAYLLMGRLPGEMACCPALMRDPTSLVRLLAEGLRMLWALPTAGCPAGGTLDDKLALAAVRVQNNLCGTDDAEPGTYGPGGFSGPAALLAWLQANRPRQREAPVFCHGDYCLPNIFVREGKISGFLDLGGGGPGDKYQDIALCHRSLLHNFDGTYTGQAYPGLDAGLLFRELGIQPDWERLRYYILLDELF